MELLTHKDTELNTCTKYELLNKFVTVPMDYVSVQ